MKDETIIKARIVKTPTICFISDCFAGSGYNYEYHCSEIDKLYFDGELPTPSFKRNWWVIKQFPTTIQNRIRGKVINERYEINDPDMVSIKLPAIVTLADSNFFTEGAFIYSNLYTHKFEYAPDTFEDVEIKWEVIFDTPDFKEPPKIEFTGIRQNGYSDCEYLLNNSAVLHQALDEMIFPEVLIHERPCKFTSSQVYSITRNYIINHIDPKVAKITSNFNFCFEVKKLVPRNVPEKITFNNIFAKTKKERNVLHTNIENYAEYTIFEMTSEDEHYKGYTTIQGISAKNETELNDKINYWLTELMAEINKPIVECPHCNGKGIMYAEDIKKLSQTPKGQPQSNG